MGQLRAYVSLVFGCARHRQRQKNQRDLKLGVAAAAVCLSACSSIQSIQSPTDAQADGLTYYMPTQEFLVKLSVTGGAVTNVSFRTSEQYADRSEQFLLRYAGNGFGKNELDVVVTPSGLLSSAQAKTTSSVTDALKGLAASVGKATQLTKTIPTGKCLPDGDHEFFVKEFRTHKPDICGVSVDDPQPIIGERPPGTTPVQTKKEKGVAYSGLFYRQLRPFKLSATVANSHFETIVNSTLNAEIQFLPIARTFFANNRAEFAFSSGVPTTYKQDTDGELVGLFTLPAEVIKAYFGAVGELFTSFGTNSQNETIAINNKLALELATRKFEACKAALDAKDTKALEALGCNIK